MVLTAAEKISRMLKDRGWSQAFLAKRSGLKLRNLAEIISGNRTPRVDTAIKISKALGVPCDWLFDPGRGMPPPLSPEATTDGIPDSVLVKSLDDRMKYLRALLLQSKEIAAEIESKDDDTPIPKGVKAEMVSRSQNIILIAMMGGGLAARLEDVLSLAFEMAETTDRIFKSNLTELFFEYADSEWLKYDKWGRVRPEWWKELKQTIDSERVSPPVDTGNDVSSTAAMNLQKSKRLPAEKGRANRK